jgi:hypothetical protein
MMFEAEPPTFPDVVRSAPDEFLILYSPFQSWARTSFSAVIRRRRTGFLRKVTYSYTLRSPGLSGVTLSTGDQSRGEVVERMVSDNLEHNDGRTCWVEF